MLYPLLRTLLFTLNPETAHKVTLQGLQLAHWLKLTSLITPPQNTPVNIIMDLRFPNRIGLAAGFDKNGEYINALAALGFGFIEIGTITPQPQTGNPPPRIFRLPEQQAIINRLGFNNRGMDYVAQCLEKSRYQGILGINIGKNRDTPLDKAIDDYVLVFRRLHHYASYITINISSPNTPQLRDLQQAQWLIPLLKALKKERDGLQKHLPLVVKISPDLTQEELETLVGILVDEQVDGIIATNTTISREGVGSHLYAQEIGGLSGKPLHPRSTHIIRQLHTLVQGKIPIIGVGGITDITSAQEKLVAGASLLQLYTGLIYHGLKLVRQITKLQEFPLKTMS
ncbi:MAG TPA: quinone-dependent dihydroorotate dehydrogenase [Gammaproteobacteria bacterium]|nr:MAG: dihydroorotate dehydrogenase (quinone) [Gammaproteobacteria bacterium RIFCSPHIGHO2_12_FULL_41_20]HLB43487.1 quinone-dependent dihydroorotate dehydrogenase [Gammaproteobacteria bacterium]